MSAEDSDASAFMDESELREAALSVNVRVASGALQDVTNRSPSHRTKTVAAHKQVSATRSASDEDEDDGHNCPICMDPYTTTGEHQATVLKCGHLYGNRCIRTWLKQGGLNKACPSCNAPVRAKDLVSLTVTRVCAVDNSDKENILRSLERERKLRLRAEEREATLECEKLSWTKRAQKAEEDLRVVRTILARTKQAVEDMERKTITHPTDQEKNENAVVNRAQTALKNVLSSLWVRAVDRPIEWEQHLKGTEFAFIPAMGVTVVGALNIDRDIWGLIGIPCNSNKVVQFPFANGSSHLGRITGLAVGDCPSYVPTTGEWTSAYENGTSLVAVMYHKVVRVLDFENQWVKATFRAHTRPYQPRSCRWLPPTVQEAQRNPTRPLRFIVCGSARASIVVQDMHHSTNIPRTLALQKDDEKTVFGGRYPEPLRGIHIWDSYSRSTGESFQDNNPKEADDVQPEKKRCLDLGNDGYDLLLWTQKAVILTRAEVDKCTGLLEERLIYVAHTEFKRLYETMSTLEPNVFVLHGYENNEEEPGIYILRIDIRNGGAQMFCKKVDMGKVGVPGRKEKAMTVFHRKGKTILAYSVAEQHLIRFAWLKGLDDYGHGTVDWDSADFETVLIPGYTRHPTGASACQSVLCGNIGIPTADTYLMVSLYDRQISYYDITEGAGQDDMPADGLL
eukprot:Clim_evm18s203 gene=Clim_evmTU18s203